MELQREQWKSQLGFVFATVGSAVGLGNIWRFSYMAYSHGGGAFLIPYIIALLSAGIPLLILEFALGHERMGSAPLAFAKINKNWEWLGWWAVIFVMFGIVLYYAVIIAWCLNFFFLSFYLGWGDDPNTFFFNKFLAVTKSPSEIGHIRTPILVTLSVVWLINWGIVFRGVRRGIEYINKIFMPLLFFLTAVLVLWSISLDGSMNGLKAYLEPDFSKLSDPAVWIDAYSQIFFTLSLGFGIMIAYASYLPGKANITKNAILTVFINSGYSLFAGIAVFSVLGFMATSQGKPISEVVSQSIGLAFVAYPKAVSLIPGGNLFGAIFFLCLFIAGLSSSISIVEAFISATIDKFGFSRKPLITLVTILGFLGSIIFTTQAGLLWLDIVDHFITHYGLIVVGIAECLLVGWLFNIKVLRKHINSISSIRLGNWWDITIKYFVPFVLGVILIGELYAEIKQPYGGYSWTVLILIGWNWILLTIIAAFVFARRPWKTRYYEIEGRSQKNNLKV
ncbi:MAG: sodium-dependent transporter [Deltaproteobacteria bacterium]|nr:sodium-dependent transporter [Deltaproteobacteria bacterium]MDL1962665.1 sodium-dependent transporter [Deltaproteobacteria bacterium]